VVIKRPIDSDWLEPVLTEHLGRVPAPQELWRRLQTPRFEGTRSSRPQLAWALATTLAIVAVAWSFHTRINATTSHDANLTLRCADPARIRAWVKANTGLDVPLPDKPAAAVQLVSARAVQSDPPSAEVDYVAAGHEEHLLVSKARSDGPTHQLPGADDRHASWTMRGQVYTLACADPAELKAACLLCHVGGQSL
jgi:hypothetical protein